MPIFTLIFLILVLAGAATLVWMGVRNHRRALAALPPSFRCASSAEALDRIRIEQPLAQIVPVLGTGSMAPWIPAAKPDQVVAYACLVFPDYAQLRRGDVVSFRVPIDGRTRSVLHQLAQRDRLGWVPSGLANPASDAAAWRVTAANFLGRCVAVYLMPPFTP